MSNLFDPEPSCNGLAEGEARRDAAHAGLEEHRPEIIRQLRIAAIRISFEKDEFTSDDVRAIVPIPEGINPKVVGAAIAALARANLFLEVGQQKSTRPEAHARRITVWRLVNHHEAMTRLNELRNNTR